MVGWYHRFNGHELGQTPGDGEGQGSLVSCSLWGHRVRHDLATEQQFYHRLDGVQVFQLATVPATPYWPTDLLCSLMWPL